MARDTSKDGFKNKLETYTLTHFKAFWNIIQSNKSLERLANKFLINSAIYKVPTRPYPFSLMAPYTSWDSLTDRTYTGRHLPANPKFNQAETLPKLEDLAVLFKKRGETRYSEKSTLLFPYFVQWFTDGFLRTDPVNRLKNTSNHHIDLCQVYGLTHKSTELLRSHQGGKLKSQILNGEEYPLFYYEDPENGIVKSEFAGLYEPVEQEKRVASARKRQLFAMGVERANVQMGYVMLNVLFLREHNRLCDELAQAYPDWDDERLFQTARNTVMVVAMKVVVEEYVNHITPYNFKFIVDPPSFTNEKWYRLNWMTIEFTLVYRWHSALPDTLTYDNKPIALVDTLWNNDLLIDKGLGTIFEETSAQPAAQIGLHNTADALIPVELASINLGRLSQVTSYNDYRKMCKYPPATDYDQITSDVALQQELRQLYGHVDNLEFYVGLYAEDVREHSALQPLVGRLVGIDAFSQALTSPLLAESVFNEQTFSPIGWKTIQNTQTLSDLIHRNPKSDRRFKVTFYRDQPAT